MNSESTVKVLVDDEAVRVKGALPGFESVSTKVINIGVEQLTESATSALEGIYALLRNIPLESDQFSVDSIKFMLRVDANGTIALVSVAKATLGSQAGIEITLSRRGQPKG